LKTIQRVTGLDRQKMTSTTVLVPGDCFDILPEIPSESVDMILADLPYGSTGCKWDSPLPLGRMWAQAERVIKPRGAIVLTATQPFTSVLVMSNKALFKYDWVWNKTRRTDFVRAKIKPMGAHESVLVFSRASVANGANENMNYYPQGLRRVDKKQTNHNRSRSTYLGYRYDHEDKVKDDTFRLGEYTQEFEGYPCTQLDFASESKPTHSTQKPVSLMRYLIETYTRPGETVLDFTMGSGTTGVAAVTSERDFIGIELDPEYFADAEDRIQKAKGNWFQQELRKIEYG